MADSRANNGGGEKVRKEIETGTLRINGLFHWLDDRKGTEPDL